MAMNQVMEALESKGYTVHIFSTAREASAYLARTIRGKTVGFGDSATLLEMGLYKALSPDNEVFDPQHCPEGSDFHETATHCLTTDVFLTSVNALARTGEMVNLDGTGNRIAGSLFGHRKVVFVVGRNKLVPTLDEAIWRTRNIAAPRNAKRLGLRTPCALRGDRCYDCSSPERICNGLLVYLRKMNDLDAEVILIDEDMGL